MTTVRWTIQLLGELRARRDNLTLSRFYTHKIASLLAYLAFYPNRPHPREELIERFWPDADLEQGRMSLRTALASLRRQLEPPGTEPGSALLADRAFVRLLPESFSTDVGQFEAALKAASRTDSPCEKIAKLQDALSIYSGDLLPGFYEDWVLLEREHLSEARFQALRHLAAALEQEGKIAEAVEAARQAVQANALEEAARADLMRLYALTGQSAAALRQYQDLERRLREELDTVPSANVQQLAEAIRQGKLAPSETPAPGIPVPEVTASAPEVSMPTPRPASTLPTSFTPFFGREAERTHLQTLLSHPETRLVTLTGLGGSGKTRLSLEIARQVQSQGERAVFFAPLADLTEARLLPAALRAALRLEAAGQADPLASLIETLNAQPTLFVLDNFEQLVDGGREIVRQLLENCPTLTCLVTSRLPLGLTGEQEFPVRPLPTPATPGTPAHLLEFASVRLFVNRAQAARPDFQLTPANAQAVAQLCHSLEGIPLAIELAAARAHVLTPAQMVQQVVNRFGFLVGRQKDAAERHRTMRAALEWSYQALSPRLQQILGRLSVFRGGWTLAEAEAVCDEPLALDYLMDLREASLVLSEERGGEMRFRMLETVREFAAQQLTAEETEAARKQHLNCFLALVAEARSKLFGPEQSLWLERLDSEHDNIRAALDFAGESAEGGEAGLQLTAALDWFWDVRGHFVEARERYQAALSHSRAQGRTRKRAAALSGAANIAEMVGDFAAAWAYRQEELSIVEELGDKGAIASALGGLASAARNRDDYATARDLFEKSLALEREAGNPSGIASAVGNLGLIARIQGDYATARALFEESLAIKRQFSDRIGVAATLVNLGHVLCNQGDYAAARPLFEESLAIRRERGNPLGVAASLEALGMVLSAQGDYVTARALFEESLTAARGLGTPQGVAGTLENLGLVACFLGDYAAARAALDESLTIRRDLADRFGIALSLETRAILAAAQEQPERATRLWAAAERLWTALNATLPPRDKAERDRKQEKARVALGEEAFASLWAEGEAMTQEQAVAYALDSSSLFSSPSASVLPSALLDATSYAIHP